MNALKPMTHYEYQKMIAYTWLDPHFYDERMKGHTSSKGVSSMSTNTADTIRRSRVCNSSLHPINGSLKCRLRKCDHLPTAPENGKYRFHCQLHFWATGKRKYSNVETVECVMLPFAPITVTKFFIQCGI